MSISHEAARGLESSGRWRWQFWKKTELNLEAARECLDRLDTLAPDRGQESVLKMARVAAPAHAAPKAQLRVLREAMKVLTEQVAGDLAPLAGIALRLRDCSERTPSVEAGLAAQLPASGVLGAVAPDAGWLLEKASLPYPATGSEWGRTLDGTPPACTHEALERLAPPDVRSFLQVVGGLGLESMPALEAETLASFDANLAAPQRAARFLQGQLPSQDVLKLGGWLCGAVAPQPMAELAERLHHPEGYRALARHLDQPDWLAAAAGELGSRVPGQQVAAALHQVLPEDPTLAWLARIPEDGAASSGLSAFAKGQRSRPELLLGLSLEPADRLALIECPEPLLQALLAQPWPDEAGRARALSFGWKALEERPGELSRAGLAMARSVPEINQKLYLARAALQAQGAGDLLALTRVEGPNQEWSQSALALAALRRLEQGAVPGPALTLELVREASESWAGPQWRASLLEHLSKDPALEPAARLLQSDPENLHLLSTDSLLASLVTGVQPGGVEETTAAVIVGGVRLTKRATGEAPTAVTIGSHSSPATAEQVQLDLGPPPQPGQRVQVNWHKKRIRGLSVVYNPVSGSFESHERLNRGVAGVFNPRTGKVKFEEGSLYKGISGCYDPSRGELYFKRCEARLTTCAVVYNPARRTVEESVSKRNYGLGGAYNPASGKVEFHGGGRYRSYAAAYDPVGGRLEWREERTRGSVCASNDPEYPTLASSSYAPYEEKD